IPGAGPTETYRVSSPCGGSILMTSAPMSAMIWVQYGPITIAVRSTTRTPASGPGLSMSHSTRSAPRGRVLTGHPEAVSDVLGVRVRYYREDQWVGHIADGIKMLGHLLDGP